MSRILTAIGECQSAWQQLHDAVGTTAAMKYRHGRGEASITQVITAKAAESRAQANVQRNAAALKRLMEEIQCSSHRNVSASSPSVSTSSSSSQDSSGQ